jgi:hypothetical protein
VDVVQTVQEIEVFFFWGGHTLLINVNVHTCKSSNALGATDLILLIVEGNPPFELHSEHKEIYFGLFSNIGGVIGFRVCIIISVNIIILKCNILSQHCYSCNLICCIGYQLIHAARYASVVDLMFLSSTITALPII